MIPWLLIVKLMGARGEKLSEMVRNLRANFPSSGEINMQVTDNKAAVQKVIDTYGPTALSRDDTDGVSFSYADWRFNVRSSNTEPVLRLNVESRGDAELVEQKAAEIRSLLES